MGDNDQNNFWTIINNLRDKIVSETERHIEAIPVDLMEPQLHSVLGPLLARQGTLAKEFAQCVSAWTPHSAPLFFRAMLDVQITIAWLMQDPKDRCRKYVEYGLGQSKLLLEHLKADLITKGEDPEKNEAIQNHEAWINAQKLTFLLPVELGSWSGISTRAMAIESGLERQYNLAFQTFSGAVHSTWNHICKYNAYPSESPLHRYTFLAAIPEFKPDPQNLFTIARRLDETFSLYQTMFRMVEGKRLITTWLENAFDELAKKKKS